MKPTANQQLIEQNVKPEKLISMVVGTVVMNAIEDRKVNPSYLYKELHYRNKIF